MLLTIETEVDTIDPLQNTDYRVISFDNRHTNFEHPDSALKRYRSKLNLTAFILSCYSHSGEQWGLQGEVQQCQFDTAETAGLIVYDGPLMYLAKDADKRKHQFRDAVDMWNKYVNGEVYYFKIEDEQGDEVDACGGFYSKESMLPHFECLKGKAFEIAGDASYLISKDDIE